MPHHPATFRFRSNVSLRRLQREQLLALLAERAVTWLRENQDRAAQVAAARRAAEPHHHPARHHSTRATVGHRDPPPPIRAVLRRRPARPGPPPGPAWRVTRGWRASPR